jgi:hypothetical protein
LEPVLKQTAVLPPA